MRRSLCIRARAEIAREFVLDETKTYTRRGIEKSGPRRLVRERQSKQWLGSTLGANGLIIEISSTDTKIAADTDGMRRWGGRDREDRRRRPSSRVGGAFPNGEVRT